MRPLPVVLIVCFLSSCRSDVTSRIERLENDNNALRKKLEVPKDDSEAQLKCLTAAKSYFTQEWIPAQEHGASGADFSNHYNRKFGKCFVLLESKTRTGGGKTRVSKTYKELRNVYDHLLVAEIDTLFRLNETSNKFETVVLSCTVDNAVCDSEGEFNKQCLPYLTE